ncbi:hypothetical protein ACFX14_003424 [Malus domestica]
MHSPPPQVPPLPTYLPSPPPSLRASAVASPAALLTAPPHITLPFPLTASIPPLTPHDGAPTTLPDVPSHASHVDSILPSHANSLAPNTHVIPDSSTHSTSSSSMYPMVTRLRLGITKPKQPTNGIVRYHLPKALITTLSDLEPTCFS